MSGIASHVLQTVAGEAMDPLPTTTEAIEDTGCCEAGGDCECLEGCSEGICEWIVNCICG